MLFDLRGAGRRNTVRVIYLGLAILMGGGLVLFGVGGNVGGGLLDAVKGNGGSGSGQTFEKRIQTLQKQVKLNPQNAPAWAQLAKLQSQAASTATDYDQSTGQFTPSGKAKLRVAAASWDRYVALNPGKPDLTVAKVMVQAFSPNALNEPAKAVTAMELVIDNSKADYSLYKQLAALAYLAGQTRKGDLSSAKAVSLAPKAQKKTLKQQLAQYKVQVAAQQIQQSQTTSATPPVATTG
jgi:hypothetical protein